MKKILIGSFIAIVVFGSCLKNSGYQYTCDSNYNACALKAPDAEVAALQTYLDTNGIAATKHCSGMFYAIDSAGTGAVASVCSTVFIKYKGMLTNGTVFEDKSSTIIQLPLGQLITGFKNGIPLIKVGGGIRLYVPPSLAYGSQQNGTIPPNSTLIFQVSLVAAQ